jgi:hypothetical protein
MEMRITETVLEIILNAPAVAMTMKFAKWFLEVLGVFPNRHRAMEYTAMYQLKFVKW